MTQQPAFAKVDDKADGLDSLSDLLRDWFFGSVDGVLGLDVACVPGAAFTCNAMHTTRLGPRLNNTLQSGGANGMEKRRESGRASERANERGSQGGLDSQQQTETDDRPIAQKIYDKTDASQRG